LTLGDLDINVIQKSSEYKTLGLVARLATSSIYDN